MTVKINQLQVDLLNGSAFVIVSGNEGGKPWHVNISVPVSTDGDPDKRKLEEHARHAAKRALQDAINAL